VEQTIAHSQGTYVLIGVRGDDHKLTNVHEVMINAKKSKTGRRQGAVLYGMPKEGLFDKVTNDQGLKEVGHM
jgi:hypothetical protein